VVICLLMVQLMPLPPIVSCFSKIQIGFSFLIPAHPGSPRQMAVKRVLLLLCCFELSRQSDSVHGKSAAAKKDAVKTSAAAAVPSVVDDGEMNTLLSQYLPRPANNMATGSQPYLTMQMPIWLSWRFGYYTVNPSLWFTYVCAP